MLIYSLYTILSFIFIGIAFGFGGCFVILSISKGSSSPNYVLIKRTMACAYMSMGMFLTIELLASPYVSIIALSRIVTLVVASFHAFFITYILINLINFNNSILNKRIHYEIFPLLTLSLLGFGALLTKNTLFFDIVYCLYVAYYLSICIRYSLLFFVNYKYCTKRINSGTSEEVDYNRLKKSVVFFMLALIIGFIALLSSLFVQPVIKIIATIVFICFYSYLGIVFINYPYSLRKAKLVSEADDPVVKPSEPDLQRIPHNSIVQLDNQLKDWVNNKEFIKTGITIEQLADELNTNRTYLSFYINKYQLKTFKEWINYLRIEEAQKLLLEYPDLPISEIGMMVGYTDKSNFGRQFSKLMKTTPQVWRNQNMQA